MFNLFLLISISYKTYNRFYNKVNMLNDLNFDSNTILTGIDNRFNNSTDFDPVLNNKIKNYLENYILLEKLLNKNIDNNYKLKLIEISDIFEKSYSTNITKGGLMTDFNFNIY